MSITPATTTPTTTTTTTTSSDAMMSVWWLLPIELQSHILDYVPVTDLIRIEARGGVCRAWTTVVEGYDVFAASSSHHNTHNNNIHNNGRNPWLRRFELEFGLA